MKETWKHIEGLPAGYEVSDLGNIRINYEDHFENQRLSKSGKYLTFCVNGKQFMVHRLVANAFLATPDLLRGRWVIQHIDKNLHNNAVSNLKWVNSVEAYFSSNHNEYVVKCIESGYTFNSMQTASAFYGIPVFALSECINTENTLFGLHFETTSDISTKDCDIVATGSQISKVLQSLDINATSKEFQEELRKLNK